MSETKTLNEVRKIGIEALTKALGPIGIVESELNEIIDEIKRGHR